MPRKPTLTTRPRGTPATGPERAPQNHRTVDRVTRILEEVVYSPGMTFAELVRAIRAGVAYVNVHSSVFPGGEIRGQTRGSGHGHDGH